MENDVDKWYLYVFGLQPELMEISIYIYISFKPLQIVNEIVSVCLIHEKKNALQIVSWRRRQIDCEWHEKKHIIWMRQSRQTKSMHSNNNNTGLSYNDHFSFYRWAVIGFEYLMTFCSNYRSFISKLANNNWNKKQKSNNNLYNFHQSIGNQAIVKIVVLL